MSDLDKTIRQFILSNLASKGECSVDVFASEVRAEVDKLTAEYIADVINSGVVKVRLNNDRKLFIKYNGENNENK